MTKERRLGRGLEALLGQMPGRGGAAVPAQYHPPVEPPYGGATEEPYGEPAPMADAPRASLPPEQDFAGSPGEPLETTEPTFQPEPTPSPGPSVPGPIPSENVAAGQARLDIARIESNPAQPRQTFDPTEMESLTASIASHGLLQPVVVRRVDDGYQLIAGERRLRAAKQAGWTEVPANIIEADDRQTAELAIIENLQRKDLNPLEKAASFQRYLEQYGCTQEELASRLKLDRSTIANLIRLLELPDAVQEALRDGKITQGHARALLPLGEEHEQVDFCRRIQREGLNVRQTESLVQEIIAAADAEPLGLIDRDGRSKKAARVQSEHLAALEQELRAALGLKVQLTHGARGRGKLVIHFRNHDEFERLREHLRGAEPPGLQARAG